MESEGMDSSHDDDSTSSCVWKKKEDLFTHQCNIQTSNQEPISLYNKTRTIVQVIHRLRVFCYNPLNRSWSLTLFPTLRVVDDLSDEKPSGADNTSEMENKNMHHFVQWSLNNT